MHDYLTLDRLRTTGIQPPRDQASIDVRYLTILNRVAADAMIAQSERPPDLVHESNHFSLYRSPGAWVAVEAYPMGSGGALSYLPECLALANEREPSSQRWIIVQNGGLGSRLEPLSKGNKGAVQLTRGKSLLAIAFDISRLATPTQIDCIQLAPVDILQFATDDDYLKEIAKHLQTCGLVITGLPVEPSKLTSNQLHKWGFAIVDENMNVCDFVEHPGSQLPIDDALKRNKEATSVYASTFRFHWTTEAFQTVGTAFNRHRARCEADRQMMNPLDLSDVMLEGVLRHSEHPSPSKQNAETRSLSELFADLRPIVGNCRVASLGETAVSEDIGELHRFQAIEAELANRSIIGNELSKLLTSIESE